MTPCIRCRRRLARERYHAHREQVLAALHVWMAANPERVRAYRKRWQERNPDRVRQFSKGKNAVAYAIRTGKLVRPDTCQRCGATGRIEAAHMDYSKPLSVEWLCQPCHRRWDHAAPKTKEPTAA